MFLTICTLHGVIFIYGASNLLNIQSMDALVIIVVLYAVKVLN